MSRVSRFTEMPLVMMLVGVTGLVGCQRLEAATPSSNCSASTNNANVFQPATAFVGPTNFSVPFYGVIKAKEQRDLLLNSAEITYTIRKGKIRREATQIAPIGKLGDLRLGAAGVICDMQADQVVLYRTGQPGKFYTRMSVADYRKIIMLPSAGTGVRVLDNLEFAEPIYWKHIGTFFVYIPRPIPAGQAVNLPDARMVGGVTCDLLTIHFDETVFEIYHCQKIKVDRELLELVELRLPSEVSGFPCSMRRLERISVQPSLQTESKTRQLLQKAASWAGKLAEKALKREVHVQQIIENLPPDAAFTLDGTFVEVPTVDALQLKFAPPSGGDDDWD